MKYVNLFVFLESSQNHLETKKRILALRERFGEANWLSSHAGTFVQDIMGLHSVPQLSTSPIQTLADINSASSFHDTLVSAMNNIESSGEIESEVAEYTEDNNEILQNEETLLSEHPESHSPSVYDPDEGKIFVIY